MGRRLIFIPTGLFSLQSFYFDGSNEHFTTGDMALGTVHTLNAWIKPTSTAFGMIFGSSTNANLYAAVNVSTGKMFYKTAAVNATNRAEASYAFADGTTWYLVSWVRNGTSIEFYVNGVSIGTDTVATNSTGAFNRIGRDGVSDYYSGHADELSTATTNLATAKILEIYGPGKPGDLSLHSSYASFKHNWRMGEDATIVTNWTQPDSISGNTATSVNMEPGDRTTDVPV